MSGNIIGLYGNTNSTVTVSARNTTGLYPGTGGVSISSGGNYGDANVEALLLNYTGNIQAGNLNVIYDITTGAIYTDNYYYANGAPFSGGGNSTYGNANVAAYLSSGNVVTDIITTADVTANNVVTPTVYNNGMVMQGYDFVQMQYSNAVALPVTPYDIGVGSWFYLDPGGGIFQSNTTGTLQTVALGNDGTVSASGNITAPYYFGNGSQLTGIAASYGNANVSNFLANGFGSNTITTTGNIEAGNVLLGDLLGAGNVVATGNVTGTYFIGNGSQLTGLPATYGNANVAAYLPTYTGDLQAGNITVLTDESVGGELTVTGNVTSSGYLRTTGVAGNITGADYVSANYFVGNGSLLTGIVSSYGNANVATYLSDGTFVANVITSGNVSGNYILGNGSQLTGIAASYGNANVATYLSDGTFVANVVTSGNVSGSYILGNGSQLTGLPATYGNANVSNFLANGFGSNTITTTGNITANYFVGNGSALTGITASAGGSNTQIQFNNATALAGNAAMTFDVTTGNVQLQNLRVSNASSNPQLTTSQAYSPNSTFTQPVPGRILVGDGYYGNLTFSPGAVPDRTARLAVIQSASIGNTGTSSAGFAVSSYANLTANTSIAATSGVSTSLSYGGSDLYAFTGNYAQLQASRIQLNLGKNANLALTGNLTGANASGQLITVTLNGNSTATNLAGQLTLVTGAGGTLTNAMGQSVAFQGGTTPSGQVIAYYMSGNASGIGGQTQSAFMRNTSGGGGQLGGYWFLRGDDQLAQSSLASLSQYHEYRFPTTSTSGAVTVNKNNGQVQYISPTGAVTAITFSNFVTVASSTSYTKQQTDTVTLIIAQGATPYAVTLPTGAAYKYAGNTSTVGTTANAVTMVVVTATDIGGTLTYLITVSPEFV